MHHQNMVLNSSSRGAHQVSAQRQLLPTAMVQHTPRQHKRTAVQAAAGAAYANPIGVHALVFAGDWSEASVVAAASGAAKVSTKCSVYRTHEHMARVLHLYFSAEAVQGA
jgi:hypothetical protein